MLSRPAQPAEQAPPTKRSRLGGALTTTSQTAALPRMVRTTSGYRETDTVPCHGSIPCQMQSRQRISHRGARVS